PPAPRRWPVPRVAGPARRMRRAPLLAALAVCVVAASTVVGGRAVHRTGTGSASPAAAAPPLLGTSVVPPQFRKGAANPPLGGPTLSSPIGIVARMAAGHMPAELAKAGYSVWDAASTKLGAPASAVAGGLVSLPAYVNGALVDLQRLRHNPAIAAVGYVRAQTSDPSLRSFDYKLSDKPAAQRFLIPAEAAIVAGGFATRAQINAPASIRMISDDPIDPGQLIVTATIEGPLITLPATSTITAHSLIAVVAFIDRASARVLDVGFGSWYVAP
ncbi:MAG: hypothetical protein ACREQ5_36300, partial [Candidatus Dormibacteria bacterium]